MRATDGIHLGAMFKRSKAFPTTGIPYPDSAIYGGRSKEPGIVRETNRIDVIKVSL